MRLWLILLGGLLWLPPAGAQDDELLEPGQAFRFSASALDAGRVEVRWDIAPGYYMYRDKFRVQLLEGDATLGPVGIPPGKPKQDPFFGELEVHTGSVKLDVPVQRQPGGPLKVLIEAQGQGCNEPVGVCYPPLKQTARLTLAALGSDPASPAVAPPVTSLKSLKDLLSGAADDPEFLSPDQAFRFDLTASSATELEARFAIEPGYYLYRDKVAFASETPGVTVAGYQLPAGKEKYDQYFGRIEAYYEGFEVIVPLARTADAALPAVFTVNYQGCADEGICYPPITKTVRLDLPALKGVAAVGGPPAPPAAPAGAPAAGTAAKGFWGYVLTAFLTGIVLTFTPCVLPMVPILSSVIVGQGGTITRLRGGSLATAYVLGTAVTYTAAGVLAGATGEQLQAYFQNPWMIGAVSVLLLWLALSMFGLFDIQMPSFIQSRLQSRTQALQGGQLGMVFVLGLVSAMIVGACVSPLLIVALGVAIASGDPLLGGAIMFAIALGMGVFLIALGFGAGYLLPKAGGWMDRVKQVFGVLLLAVAIYLLGTIPAVPVLYLWAALFIICAVYLGALQSLPEGASGWRYLWKGTGVLLLVWGVLALLGGMAGERDILRPVALKGGWPGGNAVQAPVHARFERLNSLTQLDQRLAQAQASGRPLMLDYYADWCVDCVRMERATFQDPRVAQLLNDQFVLLQADVTDPADPFSKAVKQRYRVFGPPAMLFFSADGHELTELRRYGFMDADEFLSHLDPLLRSPAQITMRATQP